jgi:hypothetical protein
VQEGAFRVHSLVDQQQVYSASVGMATISAILALEDGEVGRDWQTAL